MAKKKVDKSIATVKHIDVEQALKMRLHNNLSYEAIGEYFGVTKQAVEQRLKKFTRLINDPELIPNFEANKAHFLSSVEMELLTRLLDPAKLKDASLNNVAYAFQQVFNANRLVQNKSTGNINYQECSREIEELEKQITEYEEKSSGKSKSP